MRKIDVHTHFYPAGYLERLSTMEDMEIRVDASGRRAMYEHGARVATLTPAMEDIELRLQEMDRVGMDVALLSLTGPNVYFASPQEAPALARDANAGLLEACRRAPDRLQAFASVPLQNPARAAEEWEWAYAQGMVGVIIGTTIRGRSLIDPAWEPFWEACNQKATVIFLHPMGPLDKNLYQRYGLGPLLGFINDTNVDVSRLIFDGFFDRYPRIRLIVPHLGGSLPYLAARLDNGFRAYPECREHITDLPSTYLKRLYYDTVSFHGPALESAIATVGANRLVLGSDWPHVIGDMEGAIRSVNDLGVDQSSRDAIFGGNVQRMLGW